MTADLEEETSGQCMERFQKGFRIGAIYGGLVTTCVVRGNDIPFDEAGFFGLGSTEIEALNRSLRYPFPELEFKEAVCKVVGENAEDLMVSVNQDWFSLQRDKIIVLDYYDSLTTYVGIETLFHDSTELMLMEQDLAEEN